MPKDPTKLQQNKIDDLAMRFGAVLVEPQDDLTVIVTPHLWDEDTRQPTQEIDKTERHRIWPSGHMRKVGEARLS